MKYTVSGLGAVTGALYALDVDVKTMRKELRPAANLMKKNLRLETPQLSGTLRSTTRSSVTKLSIKASVGSRAQNYANWNNWGKTSPNKRFSHKALYGHRTIPQVETVIANGIDRIITKLRLNEKAR